MINAIRLTIEAVRVSPGDLGVKKVASRISVTIEVGNMERIMCPLAFEPLETTTAFKHLTTKNNSPRITIMAIQEVLRVVSPRNARTMIIKSSLHRAGDMISNRPMRSVGAFLD